MKPEFLHQGYGWGANKKRTHWCVIRRQGRGADSDKVVHRLMLGVTDGASDEMRLEVQARDLPLLMATLTGRSQGILVKNGDGLSIGLVFNAAKADSDGQREAHWVMTGRRSDGNSVSVRVVAMDAWRICKAINAVLTLDENAGPADLQAFARIAHLMV